MADHGEGMVRVLVLGAGPAGRRHGSAFRALADRCVLMGVYDPDPAASAELALALGVPVVDVLEPALEQADAAIVCGDVEHRPSFTRRALERGLDVLVEPPLASAPDIAHGLLSAIVRAPRRPVAMVAFDEHFDPTVRELRALVADQTLVSVDVERMEPAAEAGPNLEVDVVQDLMQGDLQFVLALAGETIAATQAAGRRMRRSGPIDHAHALLVFEDDVVATLTASRATGTRVRRITVVTQQARVVADLDRRAVEAVRTTAIGAGRHEAIAQRIDVPPGDATLTQADTFLRYIARRTAPDAGIGTAIACHEAALAILKRIELVAHRPASRRGPLAA
jgi:predicted dehydrogenase